MSDQPEFAIRGRDKFWYVVRVKITGGGKRVEKMAKAVQPCQEKAAAEAAMRKYIATMPSA